MYVRIFIALFFLAGIVTPPIVAAAEVSSETIARLEAELARIRAQVAQLQLRNDTLNAPTALTPAPLKSGSRSPRTCPRIVSTLVPGSRDTAADGPVARLQQWLARTDWYPEGLVTGYYGVLTARSVQRLQRELGVVSYGTPETTGYGVYGPKTREAVAQWCERQPEPPYETEAEPLISSAVITILPASTGTEATLSSVPTATSGTPLQTQRITEERVYRKIGDHELSVTVSYSTGGVEDKRPAVVWFHGERWKDGGRGDIPDELVDFLVRHGVAVLSFDYRLVPETLLPGQVDDALEAIRWVHDHASEYGIDPRRIYPAGRHAGAHIALLAALTRPDNEAIAGVVNMAGQSDLALYADYERAYNLSFLRDALGCDPNACRSTMEYLNPVRHVTSDSAPVLTVHAVEDTVVPYTMSPVFTETLRDAGVQAQLITLNERDAIDRLPDDVLERIVDFVAGRTTES